MIEKRKRGRPFKTGEARTVLRTLRIPPSLDARIAQSAQEGKRSFSDEVILRIEQALTSEERRRQETIGLLNEAIAGRGGPEAAKRLAELFSEPWSGLPPELRPPDPRYAQEQSAAPAPTNARRRSKK
jgi:hypothetical protein